MNIIDVYRRIARSNGLPKMAQGGCNMETKVLNRGDDVWKALLNAEPEAGWIQCQSHQMSFTRGAFPKNQDKWGMLLAAEVVTADGKSLHLLSRGGKWYLTTFAHEARGELLFDHVQQRLHTGGMLNYRRYWRTDPEQGCIQTCACLIGIDEFEPHQQKEE